MYIFACDFVHVSTAKKPWTIASARQQLAEIVRMAASAPQHIYRRDTLVAVITSPELAAAVESQHRPSLSATLAELQRLCAEDDYELTIPSRTDRANPMTSPPTAPRVRGRKRVRTTPRR
jgi:hypothetical protein